MAATILGWELVDVNPEAGTIEVAFRADVLFVNPIGVVQGGFLAAKLDGTLGRPWSPTWSRAGSLLLPTFTFSSLYQLGRVAGRPRPRCPARKGVVCWADLGPALGSRPANRRL